MEEEEMREMMQMQERFSSYVSGLMNYIEMEYDNIPEMVSPDMQEYFLECFNDGQAVCFPNAAGVFWERFLRSSSIL